MYNDIRQSDILLLNIQQIDTKKSCVLYESIKINIITILLKLLACQTLFLNPGTTPSISKCRNTKQDFRVYKLYFFWF